MHMTVAESPITPPWQAAPAPNSALLEAVYQEAIHAHLNLHPAVARIAARRISSVAEIETWLNPLRAPFCDPTQIHDVDLAVTRLRHAIQAHQSILVFGDYDTDGITATALMTQALRQCGARVTSFIPDREREGYGLTPAAIERCLNENAKPDLLVTVDCGISCVDEVASLNQLGIEVIITDHHVPPEQLPPAYAIVNPRLGAPKGAENMCGCATAHALIRALAVHFPACDHRLFLDLVAIATIADVMSLTGENRSLVTKGLSILSKYQNGNPGLHALAEVHNLKFAELTAEQLAFKLIPCINAASRIGNCACACTLINLSPPAKWSTQSDALKQACRQAANELKAANQERREIEAYLRNVIDNQALPQFKNLIFAAGTRDEGFHPGVLGIVAARLSEQSGVPAVVCCIQADGSGCGSIRSRGGWHAVKALDTVSDLLAHYGGHAAASGFSLKPGAFKAFRERFPKAFEEGQVEAEPITYDESLDCVIDEGLLDSLDLLEPFGNGNPKPVFAKTFILNTHRNIGADKTHLDLTLRDPARQGSGFTRAVWFGAAHRASTWQSGMRLRLLFTISRDTYHPNVPSLHLIDALPLP